MTVNSSLPFLYYDSHMFPAGAGAIAAAVYQAGFARTRAVFQLWNPNFRPSRAEIDGRRVQMLLVSSMQIHARRAYAAIREAWRLGDERPLIVAGGPKAIYEPAMPGDAPVTTARRCAPEAGTKKPV